MLQSMGSQRVGHDWATEQQQHTWHLAGTLGAGIITHSTISGQSKSPSPCFTYFQKEKMRFEHSAAFITLPLVKVLEQRGGSPGLEDRCFFVFFFFNVLKDNCFTKLRCFLSDFNKDRFLILPLTV